jgi:hypothetical protein
MTRHALTALLLLLAAPAGAFDATGEIFLSAGGPGASAAFDEDRVVGPNVNLTRMEGGAWTGDLRGQNVALEVTDKHIRGPNFEVFLEHEKKVTSLRGNVFGRRYNLEWGEKGLSGRVGNCSLDLVRKRNGMVAGQIGCMRSDGGVPVVTAVNVKFIGQAGQVEPPLPQFAFALLAVVP